MRSVDISHKPETLRSASAYGRIRLRRETVSLIREGKVPKGDVLYACRLAGLIAVKRTPELLPFCHPVGVESAEVQAELLQDCVEVFSTVKGTHKTGYEMEALTAVSVALLTVYDMCKGLDDSMVIEEIKLLEKSGGKSQWSKSLSGLCVKVLSEGAMRELLERELSRLGAVLCEESPQLVVSTVPLELSSVWGISCVVNQKLFTLLPERLKRGVRVGSFRGKPCVEIEADQEVVKAFFESFGGLLGNWADGGAV
ncbi:MAG: cyclic pyranopterin monophosphate synthase MoaC [Aquificaceae bacterium]|nr:cyclic pyranopterin monophosphate synthase MoaC [Aquificaceae bacterium]MDW8096885.1 cyclic pyranopterin monophosphate synthase MoaC [Aquificaceae bacterium]